MTTEATSFTPKILYEERLSSRRTAALFVALTALFLSLFVARVHASGLGYLAAMLLGLACFFAFYAVNYRTLVIRVTPDVLALEFGVFRWTIPWDTVADGRRDDTSMLRVGGAGIHFTMRRGRYRVFFNFLEHPRVVVALTRPRGPVRDVAFSTSRPTKVLELVTALAGTRRSADAMR